MGGLSDGEGKLTSEIAAGIGQILRSKRIRLALLAGNGLAREMETWPQDPERRYFLIQ